MAAKIFVSFNVITTSDVILVAREMSAPLAEVFRQFYAAPHTQQNLTITPVNPVMHIVQVYKTTDGVTLGQLMGQCDIDASISTQQAFNIVTFIVDRGLTGTPNFDPTTPTNQYVNPEIDGKTYVVFKPGFGALQFGTHIQTIAGGGFEFINGDQFNPGEEYTLMVSDLVTTTVVTSGAGYPSDVMEIVGNINLGPSHYTKLLEVNAAGVTIINIVDINAIPNSTVFGINTHNGTQTAVILQLPATKYCLVNGVQRNAIYIGRAEEASFIKKGNYLRILNWDGDYKRLGQRVYADTIAPANCFPEVGGWYAKADYPRIWNWYIAALPGSEVIAGTDDVTPGAADVAKWGAGLNKFWVPDTGGYFIRNQDPNSDVDNGRSAIPGDIQLDLFKSHSHTENGSNDGGGSHGFVMDNNNTPATGATTPVSTNTTGGSETRPKNVNSYAYRQG